MCMEVTQSYGVSRKNNYLVQLTPVYPTFQPHRKTIPDAPVFLKIHTHSDHKIKQMRTNDDPFM